MKIFLALDYSCINRVKLKRNLFGGTERYFLFLKEYLESKGHYVTYNPYYIEGVEYDIAIHSNAKNKLVKAKKHICRAGSLHTDASREKYDLVIAISNYFLHKLDIKYNKSIVIPVFYDPEIRTDKSSIYQYKSIITTSNPNRHIINSIKLNNLLSLKTNFEWKICGGHKLYSYKYNDMFNRSKLNNFTDLGLLNHSQLINELYKSHVYCYPNFGDNSETFCVAAVEAAAAGLPVVLPRRMPFLEVLPDNLYYCESIEEMSKMMINLLSTDKHGLYVCDTSRYHYNHVLPQIYQAIIS